MLYARIHDGRVAELGDFPSVDGRFTPDMVWVPCPPETQEGWLYDGASFTPPPPPPREQTIERKRSETKNYAQRLIWSRYPQWRQANLQARCVELLAIEAGQMRGPSGELVPARALTASEQAELAAILQAWAWIKAVRAVSDQIEKQIEAAEDPQSVPIETNPLWPS